MERRAKVMAHRPRDENRTRNFDGCGYILSDCDRDRWNSPFLDLSLNQSDRLMANGSGRSEQDNVCSFFLIDCAGDTLSYRSLEALGVHVVADEAEEVPCESADHSFSNQLL